MEAMTDDLSSFLSHTLLNETHFKRVSACVAPNVDLETCIRIQNQGDIRVYWT